VLEGPRVVGAALDRGAPLERVFVGTGVSTAFAPLMTRLEDAGVPVMELKEGVLEKVGLTRTPQPVLGVATSAPLTLGPIPGSGMVVIAVDVADPGNLGTIVRSAESAGADGVVVCGKSVDPHNPKVVRSSAGALFGVTVMQADDPMQVLDAIGATSRRLIGTTARGGEAPDAIDLAGPCALVVGNEAHGLDVSVQGRLDLLVSIPMAAISESLNVAMATTVVLFEAARQRRLAGADR
jgi:TrmH family RNA methyltransferase